MRALATLSMSAGNAAPAAASKHGIPILRISAVRPMTLDVGDIRFLPPPASLYRDFLVSAGDLLFTRYNGSRAHVGVAALAKQVPELLIHPDKLIRVRLLRKLVSAGFIEAASNTGASRAHLEKLIRTTAGQSGVSGSDIKRMPIPLPPVGEQARALAEVQRLLSVADASSSAIEAVRITSGGVQYGFWADIDSAPRDHIEKAFAQRRTQIVADCYQLKVDADSYNCNRGEGRPIQIVLDFTQDVAELQALEKKGDEAA
jgi:restriction endonuclease S subunit